MKKLTKSLLNNKTFKVLSILILLTVILSTSAWVVGWDNIPYFPPIGTSLLSVSPIGASYSLADLEPGLHELSIRMKDDKNVFQPGILVERHYLINIPKGFDPNQNYDILMFFHGATGTAQKSFDNTEFGELSNLESFIVIFPQSMGTSDNLEELFPGDNPPGNTKTCWNTRPSAEPDDEKCYGMRRLPDDDKFIDKIINKVKEDLNTNAFFTLGLSNGGSMAQHVAMTRNDISAVAIGGCAVPGWDFLNYQEEVQNYVRTPFAVFRFHATNDPVSTYMYLGDELPPQTLPTAELAIDAFATVNKCSENPLIEKIEFLRNHGKVIMADHWTYQNCDAGTEFYKIYSNSHVWHTEMTVESWDFLNEI